MNSLNGADTGASPERGPESKSEDIETKAGLPKGAVDGEPEGFQEEQGDDGESPQVPLPG